MRKSFLSAVALSALLAVPALAQTAPSVTDARLAAIEARLAVIEAKSAGTSGAPLPAAATTTPPAASKADKLVPGMTVSVHPIDKDLSVQDVEVGKFDLAAGAWPTKLTAHQAHGVNYQQAVAYIMDGTYTAKAAGTYLVGIQVERTGAGSGKCQTSVLLGGEQVASDATANLYSSASRGEPFQHLVNVNLADPGNYELRFIVACTDPLFVMTPMVKAPTDNGPHGFRADEVQHKATGGTATTASAKK